MAQKKEMGVGIQACATVGGRMPETAIASTKLAAAILQALDEQMSLHLGLTDVEALNQAMNIAHNEDVSTWVETIAQCLQEVNLQPFRSCSFRK
jgi:hypothetical protein